MAVRAYHRPFVVSRLPSGAFALYLDVQKAIAMAPAAMARKMRRMPNLPTEIQVVIKGATGMTMAAGNAPGVKPAEMSKEDATSMAHFTARRFDLGDFVNTYVEFHYPEKRTGYVVGPLGDKVEFPLT